jgi:hypothetical protein
VACGSMPHVRIACYLLSHFCFVPTEHDTTTRSKQLNLALSFYNFSRPSPSFYRKRYVLEQVHSYTSAVT